MSIAPSPSQPHNGIEEIPFTVFQTFSKSVEFMQAHSLNNGYAMSKLRSKREFEGEDGQKLYHRNWFQCDRHSKLSSQSSGKRKSSSRGTGCPFQIQIDRQDDEKWSVSSKNTHNHLPSIHPASHSVHRELSEKTKSTILSMSATGSTPRHILASIIQNDKDLLITRPDIHNVIQKAELEFLNGRTKIQALMDELQTDSEWVFKVKKDKLNRITHLFFALSTQVQLLRAFPDVLLMDCTYKTNRYNMPLLHIVGKTPVDAYFSGAFCFMNGESDEDYDWVLVAFQELIWSILQPPSVIITDEEKSLIKALKRRFPDVPRMLCSWHIQKNILKSIAKSWQRNKAVGDTDDEKKKSREQAEEKKSNFLGAWLTVSCTITFYYYIFSPTIGHQSKDYPRVRRRVREIQTDLL